jgi:hypothetical protein
MMGIQSLGFTGGLSSQATVNPNSSMSVSGKRLEEFNNHSYIADQKQETKTSSALPNNTNSYGSKITDSLNQQKDKFSMSNLPVIHPGQLTSSDRLSQRPVFDAGDGYSPVTVGDTISNMLENVHDKTMAYEEETNQMLNKSTLSPLQMEKDSLTSSTSELSFHHSKQENQKSEIEQQIDGYMGIMKNSYEYYIFTSLTIDMGKGVSQTANNLTRG